MRWLAIVSLGLALMVCTSGQGSAALTVACFNNHCDTMLDIEHADITASLIGCNPSKEDHVLVDGRPQDGVLWTLLGVSPQQNKPVDPLYQTLLTGMHKPDPTTFPEVRVRLKPGYYSSLTLSVGACTFGPFPLATTGASGDRHVLLMRQTGTAASTGAANLSGVYGYVPLPNLQITLTGGDPKETLTARNETDLNPLGDTYMYFFDAVKPGRYTIDVYSFGWSKNLGDVNVEKSGEMVLRYIHPSELGL